ncbi:hypothetical protein SERLA73DRAFT_184508 [Serpula lacrymans var. lacrymans S7.3]|uniref:Uncharacterized protein n=2 Tax=Serpula lacrymans var. lacrymans TaxID=341189 RepID=F8Q3E0_SERL3|nr:uncharacterized protein SERLADRAFT_472224 [Serpula lacrymans var. lacrymans S7.9]EGN97701.1 hypothetical protein SERLA73DRAFT_184508 [Serpula lacrymans var. lacrymans S7.3]EGO23292.1 hypothetical protein SERLADRAFT_472224 [Serpula lacrymans var. lacrymans S7.9]
MPGQLLITVHQLRMALSTHYQQLSRRSILCRSNTIASFPSKYYSYHCMTECRAQRNEINGLSA